MSRYKRKPNKPQQKEIKADENIDKEVDAEVEETEAETIVDKTEDKESEAGAEAVEEAASDDENENESDDETLEEKEEIDSEKKKSDEKEAVSESVSDAEFRKLPFLEKCSRDPLIPLSLLLAFVVLIVAGIYFVLPEKTTPSMGLTVSEFVSKFDNGGVATFIHNNGNNIGFRTPDYVNPKEKPSIMAEKEVVSANLLYADFFSGPASFVSGVTLEGATRKSDGELAYIRIAVIYDGEQTNGVWMYFSNTINAFFPELDMYEAMDEALTVMSQPDDHTKYYTKGDYAFRLVPVLVGENKYIVIEVVPVTALRSSQIIGDIDQLVAESKKGKSTESSSADSSAESSVESSVEVSVETSTATT